MNIEWRSVESLIPYARNSRTHSDGQVAQIAASIREFGWTNPVLVDGGNGIIAGHGRVLAARKLGEANVPVIELAHMSEAQKRAYIIADNKLAMNAGWDEELLALEICTLTDEGYDIGLLGFTKEELAALLAAPNTMDEGLIDDDQVPAIEPEPASRIGDTWIIGRHRLRCGDSTSVAEMRALMDGQEADLVWTDPPYNVAYEGGTKDKLTIQNDSMEDSQFYRFLLDAFAALIEVTKPGGCIYIAHADSEGVNFRTAMKDAGWMQKQCLIWVKNSLVLGRQDYNWKHEPILYGWKPGAAHYFGLDFTNTTVLDDDIDVSKMKKEDLLQIIKEMRNALPTSVIREDKPHRNDIHPTMKPVALVQKMVENSSRNGETVLDAFGGGGATLIACEKSGRHAGLMELDPKYVDVIVKRWEQYTGKQATLEGDGRTFDEIARERT